MVISREATLWTLMSIHLSVCQMCLGGNAIFSAPEDRGLKNKIRIKIPKISDVS